MCVKRESCSRISVRPECVSLSGIEGCKIGGYILL